MAREKNGGAAVAWAPATRGEEDESPTPACSTHWTTWHVTPI
ncbi:MULTISPECIES: hypothetical protein [unclassified Streptomyces]